MQFYGKDTRNNLLKIFRRLLIQKNIIKKEQCARYEEDVQLIQETTAYILLIWLTFDEKA